MNSELEYEKAFERFINARGHIHLPIELIDFAIKKEKELKAKGDIDIDIAAKFIGFYIANISD